MKDTFLYNHKRNDVSKFEGYKLDIVSGIEKIYKQTYTYRRTNTDTYKNDIICAMIVILIFATLSESQPLILHTIIQLHSNFTVIDHC